MSATSGDIIFGSATKVNASSINISAVTGLDSNKDHLAIVAIGGDTGASTTTVPASGPSGWSNYRRNWSGGAANGTVGAAELLVAAGTTSADPPSWTLADNDVAIGVTFAIPGTFNGPQPGPERRWTGNGLADGVTLTTGNINTVGNGDTIAQSQGLGSGVVTQGDGVRFTDAAPGGSVTRLIPNYVSDTVEIGTAQVVFTAPEYPAVAWTPIAMTDSAGSGLAYVVHQTDGKLSLANSAGSIISSTESNPLVPGQRYVINFVVQKNGYAKFRVRGVDNQSFIHTAYGTAVSVPNLYPKRIYFGRSTTSLDVPFTMEYLGWQERVIESGVAIEDMFMPNPFSIPQFEPSVVFGREFIVDDNTEVYWGTERIIQVIWDNVVFYNGEPPFGYSQDFESVASTAALAELGWEASSGSISLDTSSRMYGTKCISLNTAVFQTNATAARAIAGFAPGQNYRLSAAVDKNVAGTHSIGIQGIGSSGTIGGSGLVTATYDFTATASSHTIQLIVTGVNQWAATANFFDNISIIKL